MKSIIDRFENIKSLIGNSNVNIIAVSKTFALDHVKPLIDHGHIHFGENKVQEAKSKWMDMRRHNPNIKLHMIGKLQTNKVKDAVNIFDYIHSLDNQKLAILLSKQENAINKKLKYFIQVNVAKEKNKSGIGVEMLDDFYYYCIKELNINIVGLMVIPPNDEEGNIHFKYLMELNKSLGLKELSMGMSADFREAIKYEATFVRIGSSIFGSRF